jgi:hypothetical protein
MTRKLHRIVSKSPPSWEPGGNHSHALTLNPTPDTTSTEANPVHTTDEAAVAACYTKRTLAHYLGLSVRSLDRASAMGMLPCPDLVVGRSPRWSPDTVARWLRTKPRLPGRSRKGACYGK